MRLESRSLSQRRRREAKEKAAIMKETIARNMTAALARLEAKKKAAEAKAKAEAEAKAKEEAESAEKPAEAPAPTHTDAKKEDNGE